MRPGAYIAALHLVLGKVKEIMNSFLVLVNDHR